MQNKIKKLLVCLFLLSQSLQAFEERKTCEVLKSSEIDVALSRLLEASNKKNVMRCEGIENKSYYVITSPSRIDGNLCFYDKFSVFNMEGYWSYFRELDRPFFSWSESWVAHSGGEECPYWTDESYIPVVGLDLTEYSNVVMAIVGFFNGDKSFDKIQRNIFGKRNLDESAVELLDSVSSGRDYYILKMYVRGAMVRSEIYVKDVGKALVVLDYDSRYRVVSVSVFN